RTSRTSDDAGPFVRLMPPLLGALGLLTSTLRSTDRRLQSVPLPPQFLPQFLQRQRVDHIVLLQPAFAGDPGAEAEVAGVLVAVGVAVDHALHTLEFGVGPQAPVHVEAPRIGIEFDPGAGPGAGVDDRL